MIINLWSTPRTGSNWYNQYLLQKHQIEFKNIKSFAQYLNYYHLINYSKPNSLDYVYEYQKNCSYRFYFYDRLKQSINFTHKTEKRVLDYCEEEKYRLELLSKHNFNKNPIIFYNHIAPMSDLAYNALFDMADKNIFLYRKDIKRQISSYTLAYGTTQYKKSTKIYDNIIVEYDVIKNLVDRIIKWHKLDKTNSDVVCYEDLHFDANPSLPKQQNKVDPFVQLSKQTQDHILQLIDYFNSEIGKNSLLF